MSRTRVIQVGWLNSHDPRGEMRARRGIVLIEQATAKPHCRAALKLLLELMVSTASSSDGVMIYRMHEDRKVPGHFVIYERFADHEALDNHRSSSNFQGLLVAAGPLIEEGAPRIIYRC